MGSNVQKLEFIRCNNAYLVRRTATSWWLGWVSSFGLILFCHSRKYSSVFVASRFTAIFICEENENTQFNASGSNWINLQLWGWSENSFIIFNFQNIYTWLLLRKLGAIVNIVLFCLFQKGNVNISAEQRTSFEVVNREK